MTKFEKAFIIPIVFLKYNKFFVFFNKMRCRQ